MQRNRNLTLEEKYKTQFKVSICSSAATDLAIWQERTQGKTGEDAEFGENKILWMSALPIGHIRKQLKKKDMAFLIHIF